MRAQLEEFVTQYRHDSPGWMEVLRAAMRAGDAPVTERATHSLKGAVGIFGAAAVYHLASELEACGRAGDLRDAAPMLPMLEREIKRLHQALADIGSALML